MLARQAVAVKEMCREGEGHATGRETARLFHIEPSRSLAGLQP
jgi:hypothetical protein